jgi:hypothetical protein
MRKSGRFPLPTDHSASGKGLNKIAKPRAMAIVIFNLDNRKMKI